MSSTNLPAPSAGASKDAKKTRNLSLPLDIREMVVTQYLLPGCTWDSVEECAGWCREVVVDPAPLMRMGRDWEERGNRDEGLVRGPLCQDEPQGVLSWGYGDPTPYSDLVGRSYREESGLAGRDA